MNVLGLRDPVWMLSAESGKSTLLRLLLGFEKPETGSIYL
jgi:ABC-type thiamine transport system ATPase subunit